MVTIKIHVTLAILGALLHFWRLTDKKKATTSTTNNISFVLTEEKSCTFVTTKGTNSSLLICRSLTVISNSSFSSRATNGHQPLILFCLKMLTMGMSCSLITMSMEHCFAVFAPRGNRFRSSSIAPETKPNTHAPAWVKIIKTEPELNIIKIQQHTQEVVCREVICIPHLQIQSGRDLILGLVPRKHGLFLWDDDFLFGL